MPEPLLSKCWEAENYNGSNLKATIRAKGKHLLCVDICANQVVLDDVVWGRREGGRAWGWDSAVGGEISGRESRR